MTRFENEENPSENSNSVGRDLLVVSRGAESFLVSRQLFGENLYSKNCHEMSKTYLDSEPKSINFRPATTVESIYSLNAVFDEKLKEDVLNPSWVQIGRVGVVAEGVYVNLPVSSRGEILTDSEILRGYLKYSDLVEGILILPNGRIDGLRDFAFVPYESFKNSLYKPGKFIKSGLARALIHNEDNKADILKKIISSKNYPQGIYVSGFYKGRDKTLVYPRVAGVFSDKGRFGVSCSSWFEYSEGYAFGVVQEKK